MSVPPISNSHPEGHKGFGLSRQKLQAETNVSITALRNISESSKIDYKANLKRHKYIQEKTASKSLDKFINKKAM